MSKNPREQAGDKQKATAFPHYQVDDWTGKLYLNRPLRHTETILFKMFCSQCEDEGRNDCRQCAAEIRRIEGRKKKTRRGKRSAAKRQRKEKQT